MKKIISILLCSFFLVAGCEGAITESKSESFGGKASYKTNKLSGEKEVTEYRFKEGEEVEIAYEVSSDSGTLYLRVVLDLDDREFDVWEEAIEGKKEGMITFTAPEKGEYEVKIESVNAKLVSSTAEKEVYEGLPPSENVAVKVDKK